MVSAVHNTWLVLGALQSLVNMRTTLWIGDADWLHITSINPFGAMRRVMEPKDEMRLHNCSLCAKCCVTPWIADFFTIDCFNALERELLNKSVLMNHSCSLRLRLSKTQSHFHGKFHSTTSTFIDAVLTSLKLEVLCLFSQSMTSRKHLLRITQFRWLMAREHATTQIPRIGIESTIALKWETIEQVIEKCKGLAELVQLLNEGWAMWEIYQLFKWNYFFHDFCWPLMDVVLISYCLFFLS